MSNTRHQAPIRNLLKTLVLCVAAASSAHAQGLAERWLAAEGLRQGWDDSAKRAIFVSSAPISVGRDQPDYVTQRNAAAEAALQGARKKAAEWLAAEIRANAEQRTRLVEVVGAVTADAIEKSSEAGFEFDKKAKQLSEVCAQAALTGLSAIQTFESVTPQGGAIEVVVALSPRFTGWAQSGGKADGQPGPTGTPLRDWFKGIPDEALGRTFGTRFVGDERGDVHLIAFAQAPVLGDGELEAAACEQAVEDAVRGAALAVAGRAQSQALAASISKLRKGSEIPSQFASASAFDKTVAASAAIGRAGVDQLGTRTVQDATSGTRICVAACSISIAKPVAASEVAAAHAGDCPQVPENMRKATRQVRAEGRGADEQSAIAEALRSAIQRDGVKVEADAVLRKQYETAMQRVDAEVKQKATASTSQESSVRTFANGFIHSYEVVSRGTQGASKVVEICANLVRFDPKDPRFGLPPTVAVVSKLGRPGEVRVAGAPEDASAYLRIADSALEAALRATGRYMLIDDRTLPTLQRKRDEIARKGAAGQVDEMELMKLGRELTADLLMIVELDQAGFSGAAGPRPQNIEAGHQATAKLSARLVNVASNEVVWQSKGNALLKGRDLLQIRDRRTNPDPEEEALSPAEIATYRAAKQLVESLRTQLAGAAAQGPIAVVRVSGKEVTLDASNPSVVAGAQFVVENPVEVELAGGEKATDRDRVAVIEVTAVNGRLAKARVLEGDIDLIQAGKSELTLKSKMSGP
jgi:hypothetical protein